MNTKNLFLGFIIAIITVVTTVNINISLKSNNKSLLSLENIDALAQTEGTPTYSCLGGSHQCVIVFTDPYHFKTYWKSY